MKLHLGCGQRYLEGYINIDFPMTSHTIQEKSIADIHANILGLRYASASVDEIRLHHVFEHFCRPVACALLVCWFSWLKPSGILHIEVPDFERTSKVLLSSLSSFKKRAVAERHLFGSHEADWATHCEGYTPLILKRMLTCFGFSTKKISKNSWMSTYNFEIIGVKSKNNITRNHFEAIASNYLKNFLVDNSVTEERLFTVWIEMYRKQIETSWGHNG